MKKKGCVLKIAATYIGTVVGAGFATGQEILQFFVVFGLNGLWGIVITTALFIVFGVVIMDTGQRLKAQSHLEIVRFSGGKILGSAMDIIISFILFGSLTAMLAGTGALFKEQFGLWGALGNIAMAAFAAATVLTGKNGVFNSISVVVPFLLISVVAISIFSVIKTPVVLAASRTGGGGLINNWLSAAILYTSFNTVISIAVLGPLGASAPKKSDVALGGVLGGLGLGVGSVMIYLAVYANLGAVKTLEIPMIYIAGGISKAAQIIYAVILVAEIYTTAVGSLYGFASRLINIEKPCLKSRSIVIGISVAAFFASLLGFSNLVKYFYPVTGYAGILLLAGLLYGRAKARLSRKPRQLDKKKE